jgi:hypothetical protein
VLQCTHAAIQQCEPFGGIKYVSPTGRQWRPKNAAVILFAASEVASREFRWAQRVGRLAAATTGPDEIYAVPLRTVSQKLADTRRTGKSHIGRLYRDPGTFAQLQLPLAWSH